MAQVIRRAAQTVGPGIFFLLVSIVYNQHAWSDPSHLYAGGGSDPQQSMWFLAWVPHAVANHLNPLVTDYMNYPAGINLMWQTSEPLVGLVTAPITAAFGIVVTYNVVVTLATALAGWTAFLLLRRYTRSWSGSVLGGLLYAFSPYVVGQSLGHANLLWIAGLPLTVMLIDDIVRRQSHQWWRDGILFGVLISVQILVAEELFAINAITCLVLFAAAWLLSRRAELNWPHILRAVGLAALVSVVLCAWPLATQFFGPDRLAGLPEGHDIFATDALGFFVPNNLQLLAPQFAQSLSNHFSGNPSEIDGYLGLPLLVMTLWAAWRHRRERMTQAVVCSTVFVALLSFGPHLHIRGHLTRIPMPWDIFDHIPVLRDVLPNRFAFAVTLGVAYFLALAIADIVATARVRLRLLNGFLLVAAAATLWPATPVVTSAVTASQFFANDAATYVKAGSPALIVPSSTENSPAAMFWQIQSGFRFKLPGGYFVGPAAADSGIGRINTEITALSTGGSTTPSATPAEPASPSAAGTIVAFLVSTTNRDSVEKYFKSLSTKGPVVVNGVEIWDLPN